MQLVILFVHNICYEVLMRDNCSEIMSTLNIRHRRPNYTLHTKAQSGGRRLHKTHLVGTLQIRPNSQIN
jgi:hypothetical protein